METRPAGPTRPPGQPPPAQVVPPGGGVDGPGAPVARGTGGRAAKLTASRLHIASLVKLSFLISVGAAAAWVALVAGLWLVLWSSGLFTDAQRGIDSALGGSTTLHLMDYLAFSQVISVATALGVVGALLGTSLATLAGLAYNAVASLVGGLQLSLSRRG